MQLEALVYISDHLIDPKHFEANGGFASSNPFDQMINVGTHLFTDYMDFYQVYKEFIERAICELLARKAQSIYAPFPKPEESSKLMLNLQIVENMRFIPELKGLEQVLDQSICHAYNDEYRKEYLRDLDPEFGVDTAKENDGEGTSYVPLHLPPELQAKQAICDKWVNQLNTPYDTLGSSLSNEEAEVAALNPQGESGPWGPEGFLAKEAAKAVANGLNFKPLNEWTNLDKDVFATTRWLLTKHPDQNDKDYFEPPTKYWNSDTHDN